MTLCELAVRARMPARCRIRTVNHEIMRVYLSCTHVYGCYNLKKKYMVVTKISIILYLYMALPVNSKLFGRRRT
jgi:hypothetical protein